MKLTKAAILSLSTLSILMNAAIIPLLSSIGTAFPAAHSALIKQSLSLPALVGIFFSLLTGFLSRFIPKKVLLVVGLTIYCIGGIGAGFATSIEGFLALRALLGAGTGAIAPLASDLIADFFREAERARMIGYSNSAANITGIFLPPLAAVMAVPDWRFAFTVYALGLLVLVLTCIGIPFQKAPVGNSAEKFRLLTFSRAALWPAVSMFFLVLLFYTIPLNLSVYVRDEGIGSPSTAALVISISTLSSTIINLAFAPIYSRMKDWILPVGFLLNGLGLFAIAKIANLPVLIVGEVLIGIGLGLLFPYFPLKVIEKSSPDETTAALALLSSAFSVGMFLSPVFFSSAFSVLEFTQIRQEFILSAVLFCLGALAATAGILKNRKYHAS